MELSQNKYSYSEIWPKMSLMFLAVFKLKGDELENLRENINKQSPADEPEVCDVYVLPLIHGSQFK